MSKLTNYNGRFCESEFEYASENNETVEHRKCDKI